jgi:HlyD family secretion protein
LPKLLHARARIVSDTSLDHFLGAKPTSGARRIFGLGLLVVATVAAAALFVRFLVGSDVPYYTAPAARDSFTPVFTARGVLHGQYEITVSAGQDGIISKIPDTGEAAVNEGQELAAFDPGPIRQAVLADRTALEQAQAAMASAEIVATEMSTRLQRYENVWRRSHERVPSLNELEKARVDARKAGFAFDAAESRRDQARIQLAASKARRLSAVVVAPANGFVTARLVQPGQPVRLDQPLFTLATSLGGLKVTVPVDAAQAGSLAIGTRAHVLIEGLPDRVRAATLAEIQPAPAGSSGRQVVFKLDQADDAARPGMVATVETDLPRRENVLLVPNAALAFVPGAKAPGRCGCIYVLSRQGTPRRIDIATGASDGSRTEVLSGEIEAGTKVIIGWRGATAAR